MRSISRLMLMWCARRVSRCSSGGSRYMQAVMYAMQMNAQE